MRKALVIAAFAIALLVSSAGRAEAAGACRGGPCPGWLQVIGYSFVAALVAGYGYSIGYYAHRDLTDEPGAQSLGYGAGELAAHGALGTLFAIGTVDAVRHKRVKQTLAFGALTAVHGTLAGHGLWRMYNRRGEVKIGHLPDDTFEWVVGIAYGTNTALWLLGLPSRHGRTYGIVEASVNGAAALGMGYLAVDAALDGSAPRTVIFGGLAVVSGALAAHGVKTAISPPVVPGLDLLGTELTATVVSDGRELGPGLAARGTW